MSANARLGTFRRGRPGAYDSEITCSVYEIGRIESGNYRRMRACLPASDEPISRHRRSQRC